MPFSLTDQGDFQRRLNACKERPVSGIHSWHRYFGKLIPAIPAAAIEAYALPGLPVIDLFAGSGTTLVEAKLHGVDAVGVDISPIAGLIERVKTTYIDPVLLAQAGTLLQKDMAEMRPPAPEGELPFCIHRDNWFRPEVQDDLYWLREGIEQLFLRHPELPAEKASDVQDLLLLNLSSVIRLVSNADPQHIFPGYSKRLRALDAAGKRHIDVIRSFFSALRKKISSMADYVPAYRRAAQVSVLTGSAAAQSLSLPQAGLIVVNPPYISSVRYIETMKLELYWMGFLNSAAEYRSLERQMTGNDRFFRADLERLPDTGRAETDTLAAALWNADPACGVTFANYFRDMAGAVSRMSVLLPPGGRVVMKISDSKMKRLQIETPRLMTGLAEEHGFFCEEAFLDPIVRRSLLTARNSYSDLITHDYILVWRRL